MILAAGLGTRLRPYTQHTPKALFTIAEQPVLEITIKRLEAAGFNAIIINTHYHHQQIEAFLSQGSFSIPVQTRHEADILGTGGGIRNVADFWRDGPLLVINADIVCDIDLAEIYAFHLAHGCPVTMVMHEHNQFNSVYVENGERVIGFYDKPSIKSLQKLAFTGIHVLSREVLDFLPAKGPAHIIDTYQKIIDANESIRAYVVRGHQWYDIGTPASYTDAAYDQMAPLAFKKAFGQAPDGIIHKQPLLGDGSDRRWYRLKSARQSLIMVDHGIRAQTGTQEVDAYIDIGMHLSDNGAAVPRILLFDRCAGLVFMEDLGDTHLQTLVKNQSRPLLIRIYRKVIDQWIKMAIDGGKTFDTDWTYQTAHYDRRVILDYECRYFTEAFLNGYLGWEIPYGELESEFIFLAEKIMETQINGFLHRDFQSRNIMVQNDCVHFIDFQGGRMGPIQYDLASLLIDPYTDLSRELQKELLSHAVETLGKHLHFNKDQFIEGYTFCALSRNLQILGAFAFLCQKKGKTQFEKYIPQATQNLTHILSCLKSISLPKLEKIANKIAL